MKPTKKQLGNIAFVVFMGLVLFTPLGFHVNVFVNKIMTYLPFTGPSGLPEKDQVSLETYQWKLVDSEGKTFELAHEKGKVVVINFWATWCPPCVAEMSNFQELYNAYGNEVTFLFVAHDETEKVNRFMTKKNYDLPVYYESSSGPKELRSSSIPTTYVLNKSGAIVMKKVGAADWYSEEVTAFLDELLKQ